MAYRRFAAKTLLTSVSFLYCLAAAPPRVLYITAHPDDEDGGVLAWLARGRGADVTLLSLTRGESGANVITGDFFDRLGALRTLELLKATEVYGVKARFTSFADFGFSKNVDETWRNWDRRALGAEVVRAIQEIKPHVVISRFTGTPRDGHGQHQAAGQVAREAYEAGGAWKPQRFYAGVSGTVPAPYDEIGIRGYRWHRSQGVGTAGGRRASAAAPDYLEGIDVTDTQASTVPAIPIEISAQPAVASPGDVATVTSEIRPVEGLEILGRDIAAPPGWKVNGDRITVPENARSTSAHWNRESPSELRYRYEPPEWYSLPLPPSPVTLRVRYRYRGTDGSIERPVPLQIGPAIAVEFTSRAGVLPLNRSDYSVEVEVRNVAGGVREGSVELNAPAGWTIDPPKARFSLAKQGETAPIRFLVKAGSGEADLTATAESGGKRYTAEFHPVTYRDLDTVYLERAARHQVRRVDVQVASGVRAAYVMGSGDDVPAAIRQLGARVDLLDDQALASGDLSRYKIILLGIRAYAVREALKTNNGRLLEYVRNGGVLVVQYNTQEFDHNFGPYPYSQTMRAEEVSEENSPVEILAPDDPVFQWPNKVSVKDFDGWFEQRGSKFFTTWDQRYRSLIETHDTGQAPQKGIWLSARYGKGLWMYCALAWYRQLPFAVPGAYRIFANILSLGAAPKRQVAITIDDLPGPCDWPVLRPMTKRLLGHLKGVPITAFVIPGRCPDLTPAQNREWVKLWRDAGAELGNHSWSHPDLNRMPIAEYEADILKGDRVLREWLGHPPRFFRSPMLHIGPDEATKRRLAAFLDAHGYRQSPVTFDNCDWLFARFLDKYPDRVRAEYIPYLESIVDFFEKRSVEVVGREFPQVLLLHSNLLNAEKVPEILAMLRGRGYDFVSLDEALKDPAYSLPDGYAGKMGFSWLHRWSKAKGMPDKFEPADPDWLK